MPTEKIKYSDNLKQGTDKLNSAIEAANTAETLSTNADTKATQAVNTANLAESKADSTQTQLDTIVINGDSSVEAAQARVPVEGTAYPTLKARLDAEYNGLTADLAETRKYANVKKFGAKGDGVSDDSQAFLDAIVYANSNKATIYIPNGEYLIGQTIDFTTLPLTVVSGAEDWSYRLVFEGEDVSKTFLIGAIGLTKMFVYNPSNKNNRRSFTFKNLKIRSREPFNDLNQRANLKAFELLASPFTYFKNIDFLGINEGIHLQSCWFSVLENIAASRVRRGIFIDGETPDGNFFGFADHCYLRDIRVGGFLNEWGLRIRGSRATKIINFDSESGYTGNALWLQGCHNIDIDTIYIENFIDASTLRIEGNTTLNSISDFSTNITIKNGHIYNQQTQFIFFGRGVDGVKVEKCRFLFDYDNINNEKIPLKNQRAGLYSFSMGPVADLGNYFKNISVMDNEYYHKSNYGIVFQEGYSTIFNHGEKTFINATNLSFYTPSYRRGMIVEQLRSDTNYISFLVETEGSYGTISGVTGSINSGDNVATLSDVANIIPGTFINIGTMQRVKVMAKNPTTNKVALGENATTTITNGAVSYANPVLRYNYKALTGFTADRPTGFHRTLGTMYFDRTLNKPVWWNNTNWVDSTGTIV